MCRLMGNVVMLERTPILIILILIFIVVLEKCVGSCSLLNTQYLHYYPVEVLIDSKPENGYIKIVYSIL